MTTTALLIFAYLACGVAAYPIWRACERKKQNGVWTNADRGMAMAVSLVLGPLWLLASSVRYFVECIDWNKPAHW